MPAVRNQRVKSYQEHFLSAMQYLSGRHSAEHGATQSWIQSNRSIKIDTPEKMSNTPPPVTGEMFAVPPVRSCETEFKRPLNTGPTLTLSGQDSWRSLSGCDSWVGGTRCGRHHVTCPRLMLRCVLVRGLGLLLLLLLVLVRWAVALVVALVVAV